MNPKRIHLLFLIGVSCITLHFSIQLAKESFQYLSLNHSSPARVEKWEIIPIKKKFGIKAYFSVNNSEGSFTFPAPYFANESAALSKMKSMAKTSWTAYYKNLENAVLKKEFPLNLFFRTLICYGILIYFFNIKRKINKYFLGSN